jgi:hypothetical protein
LVHFVRIGSFTPQTLICQIVGFVYYWPSSPSALYSHEDESDTNEIDCINRYSDIVNKTLDLMICYVKGTYIEGIKYGLNIYKKESQLDVCQLKYGTKNNEEDSIRLMNTLSQALLKVR